MDALKSERFLNERTLRDPYDRFAPVSVFEVLSPSNRKGNVAQLLTDYRDLGVPEVVFLQPETNFVGLNGESVTGDTFSVAGVILTISDLFR